MHPYYPTLFSPFQLPNGVVLKNRMICPPNAPTTIQGAENYPTDHLIRHLPSVPETAPPLSPPPAAIWSRRIPRGTPGAGMQRMAAHKRP